MFYTNEVVTMVSNAIQTVAGIFPPPAPDTGAGDDTMSPPAIATVAFISIAAVVIMLLCLEVLLKELVPLLHKVLVICHL
jgi:hypothetical protein